MGSTNRVVDEKPLLERLREDYDVAFRNWAAQVRVLQSVSSDTGRDGDATEQARLWVEEAAAVYREKRDLYLDFILESSQIKAEAVEAASGEANTAADPRQSSDSPRDRSRQVQRLARQIWEESGRPADTADADWYRAEEIIHARR
jgi:hypothetical protein